MNDDVMIRVDKLGKCFKMFACSWHRVLEWGSFGKRSFHQPFWALHDISFEVRRGEFLGIIGQNGAGKSTLLKILTGVLEPTIGTYQVNGKVLSLFGLNTDFHMELSGRANIIRSIELLNFANNPECIEQIAEFSELGNFLDRPVKCYSTGMRMRLAFSLFAFLDCEVLVLDEVLATGDIFFKQKCYTRLEELIAKKTTILLATHAMNTVKHFCHNVILLDKGCKLYQGESPKGIQMYFKVQNAMRTKRPFSVSVGDEEDTLEQSLPGNDNIFWPADRAFTSVASSESYKTPLIRFATCNERGEPQADFMQKEQAYFCCEFQLSQTIDIPIIRVMITNQFNVLIHAKNSLKTNFEMPLRVKQGEYLRFCRKISLDLQSGSYVFGVVLSTVHPDIYDRFDDYPEDHLTQNIVHLYRNDQVGCFTIISRKGHYLKKPFLGVCDLSGESYFQLVSSEKQK